MTSTDAGCASKVEVNLPGLDFLGICVAARNWVGLAPPLPMSWSLSALHRSRYICWMWGEVYACGTTASYLLPNFSPFANYVSICIPLRVPVRDFGNNMGAFRVT